MTKLTERQSWQALTELSQQVAHMRDLFAAEPNRFEKYSLKAANLMLDFSKNCIDEATLDALIKLAQESGIEQKKRAMFRGDIINTTEKKSRITYCAESTSRHQSHCRWSQCGR